MDNLYNLYSLNELKFMIIFGLVLFGLCQYNKTSLAWIFLLFPVIYILIQNLIVHIHISSAVQSAPKEIDLDMLQQHGLAGATIMPQDTQQTQQVQQMVPAMKQSPDMPVTSRSSQVLGGSGSLGGDTFGGAGSSGSNFAYF
jgi:hypothetical protein